ncbi:MAG TPA: DUF1800 domain-containing protein [Chitinophagaceae bacterium]|nr:DUF1800 domain-containing protein [Chitinophagaceae bacterium]
MQNRIRPFAKLLIFSASFLLLSFFEAPPYKTHFSFPYKKAGLTEREAAAHLLSRFSYGATPGQIDEVVKMGLEKWFEQQLDGSLADDALNQKLSDYDALKLSNEQIVNAFPRPAQILQMAVREGKIDKDSAKIDKKEYRQQLQVYMREKGLRPQQELFRQFINQKVLRAAYSNNQLQEILTDFWFNHFNVSVTKNQAAQFIPNYERDVIRPNVFGKFENLVLATAKSPAMLLYLDNFSSAGQNTNVDLPQNKQIRKRVQQRQQQMMEDSSMKRLNANNKIKKPKAAGLNENYAREVMELHTLGVDGGYTQSDVTQAARVLTGWTIYPMGDKGYGSVMKGLVNRIGEDKLIDRGFVHEGDFLFAINRHDNKEKTVLGKTFPANGGYEEGVQLLKMLAHHSSTAKFISKKIAVRFVSDNPPQSLIDKMAKTFTEKDGDIKEVLITMATSPEFWSKDVIRAKTKSPFELAISAVRALNVDIKQPYQIFAWSDKMGQKLYFYQAPTGFPDKGQYWINTGSLLNRMNFGLAIASQRIAGTRLDLLALNQRHEPESALDALVKYSKLIMPERDLDETVKRLTPMLNDPDLVKKINDAADKNSVQQTSMVNNEIVMNDDMDDGIGNKEKKGLKGLKKGNNTLQTVPGNNSMLSQVVGIIIGSPEFQRK